MSYTNLNYHIVFSTKDRRPMISYEVRPRLIQYIGGILRERKSKLMEVDGPEDHIHILAAMHPTISLSDLVRDTKALCSGWIHRTFASLRSFAWQDGYSAFTVSRSDLPAVARYIRNQIEHHKKMTFREELIALLKKHEIDFDERYIQR